MIRAALTLVPDPVADLGKGALASPGRPAPAKRTAANRLDQQTFPSPPALPSWARANGRAGQGDPLFFAGAALALLDTVLRRDPACAGALRSRLALQSAAACSKILRLNADEGALRDLRFAVAAEPPPAAKLLRLWRDLAGRPPSLDARRLALAAGLLDLPVANADALAESLSEQSRVGDPISAAAKAAAAAFSGFPDAPAAEGESLALWAFDIVIAIRLRWARPIPLIATKILDPGLRAPDGGRRPKPGDPAWEKHATGAIALAAASALDLAADLFRRADTLLAIAPKLRAKPAQKSSTCCWPRIASRRPKPPARRQ